MLSRVTQQSIERVTRVTGGLDNGAQHQCSVFDFYFRALAIADLDRIGKRPGAMVGLVSFNDLTAPDDAIVCGQHKTTAQSDGR